MEFVSEFEIMFLYFYKTKCAFPLLLKYSLQIFANVKYIDTIKHITAKSYVSFITDTNGYNSKNANML